MRNKILIVLPSRGRPWHLMEAIASIQANSTGLCDILVCLDNDDPTAGWLQQARVTTVQGPRRSFIQWVNAGVMAFVHDYWAFAWGADDVRFTTKGWDELLLKHLTQKDDIVYGPDGIQNEKLPTHPFVGCAYPRALGYFIYPELKHYFADNWFMHVGRARKKLKYVPELQLEHRHHCRDHTRNDQVYKEADTRYAKADGLVYSTKIRNTSKKIDVMTEVGPLIQQWMDLQATPELRF